MNLSKIKKLAHQIIATQTVDFIKVKFLKDLVPELLKMPVVNDEFPIDVEIDEKLSEQQVKSFFDKDTRNNKKLEKIIHNPSAEYVIEKFKATNSKTTFTINWVPDFYDSESELEEMLASKKKAKKLIAATSIDSIKVKFLKDLVPELLKMPVVNDEFPIDVEIDEKLSEQQVKSFFDKDTRNNKKLEKIIHNPSAEYVIEKFKATNSKTTFTINWVPDFYDSESELEEMLASKKKATKKASDKKEFTLEEILKAAKKMLNMKEDDLIKAFQNSGYYKDSSDLVIESVERKSDLMFAGYKTALLQVVYLVGSYDKSVENKPDFGKVYVQWDGQKISADY